MKKKTTLTKATKAEPAPKKAQGYAKLVTSISAINAQMVTRVATVANQALVLRNWMVGAYIVEFEQNGADRAKYGARLLETLEGDFESEGIEGAGLQDAARLPHSLTGLSANSGDSVPRIRPGNGTGNVCRISKTHSGGNVPRIADPTFCGGNPAFLLESPSRTHPSE